MPLPFDLNGPPGGFGADEVRDDRFGPPWKPEDESGVQPTAPPLRVVQEAPRVAPTESSSRRELREPPPAHDAWGSTLDDDNDARLDVALADSFDELDFYFGQGRALLAPRGIDYGAMGSGGGGTEDEARHDARLMAHHDDRHRYQLWKMAWVEKGLGLCPRWAFETLDRALSPRRWPLLLGDRRARAEKDKGDLTRTEAELRGRLTVRSSSLKGEKGGAACLVTLALEEGSALAVYLEQPAIKALRASGEDFEHPGMLGLLRFLQETSADTGHASGKVKASAASVLAMVRSKAKVQLEKSLRAFMGVSGKRDIQDHPEAVKRRVAQVRRDETFKELTRAPEPYHVRRALELQGFRAVRGAGGRGP